MSIFKRIARLIKSNLNHWISRAEQPDKILEQAVADMRQQLREIQQRVASAMADEKRLKKQMTESFQQSDSWEKKAMRAVQLGNDELAKEALARKAQYDQLALEYQKQWELQSAAVEQLKSALHARSQKIEHLSREKELLIARQKRAEAQKMLQDTMTGLQDDSAMQTFERMSHKVNAVEAEAEAYAELGHEIKEQTLEDRFRVLEEESDVQDEALAALKARMGVLPAEVAPVEQLELEKERQAVPVHEEEHWS